MRRGCIIATVLMALVIAVGGYFGYRYLMDAFRISDDLAPYNQRDSVLARVKSKTPAPGTGEHLTPERVGLFIGALDPVSVGWRGVLGALDSMHLKDDGEQKKNVNVWASPALLREIIQLPLVTRRALVTYLNAHNISWEEYNWLKEHAVAASRITRREYDSAMEATIRDHIYTKKAPPSLKRPGANDEFFAYVEKLRSGGAIDSADIALMAPYRETLLTTGLASMAGIETDLDGDANVTFDTED